jgi:RNA polymerase sigma factor (TIGR02999 family)
MATEAIRLAPKMNINFIFPSTQDDFLSPVQAELWAESGHRCHTFLVDAEITNLLKAWSAGDPAALDQLSKEVYDELRRMARRHMKGERRDNTLQTTALVHEVYLRLVDVTKVEWQQRAQFFAIAAQMMRRILVDSARARASQKRGDGAVRVNFDETAVISPQPDRSIVALDDALAAFASVAPRQAKVVELRYFGGLQEEEIVEVLQISPRTVRRDWDFARAWLARELS